MNLKRRREWKIDEPLPDHAPPDHPVRRHVRCSCEQSGRWWYEEGRECVQPIYLPDITGRPAGATRAEASDEQNRELLAIEDRLAAERAARVAATERDRADYAEKTGR